MGKDKKEKKDKKDKKKKKDDDEDEEELSRVLNHEDELLIRFNANIAQEEKFREQHQKLVTAIAFSMAFWALVYWIGKATLAKNVDVDVRRITGGVMYQDVDQKLRLITGVHARTLEK